MDDAIRRSVERQFPELTGGYHLPRFARVVAVADAPASAGICDDFRPRYAVDIEVLGPDGEPDSKLPILAGVPLPLPTGGEEMGIYAFPEEGTQVVVCFAYGLPHKPYIQTILPHGLSMPSVPKGDQVWQHSEACQQRVDADGNWLRQTDGKIRDKAIEREVEAMGNKEAFQNHTRTVDEHSTESVGESRRSRRWGHSSCCPVALRAWRRWMICTKRPGETSTWSWDKSTTPRLVAIWRKGLRDFA